MKRNITLLGLGAMGSRMAARLLDAGYPLTVYNRSRARVDAWVERGARAAATPGQAADGADLVISMVRDDEAAHCVWFDANHGAALSMKKGATAIESSTLTPAFVRGWHEALGARGIAALDAPVSGSRPQAEAGQLIYLVGGDGETLDQAREVLSVMGQALHHTGPAGSGMLMKLAVNALFAVQAATLAEVLGLCDNAGLPARTVAEVLSSLPVTSPAARALLGLMANRSFAPMFPIELVEKDLGYVEAAAESLQAEVPQSHAARAVYARALAAGLAQENITAVRKVFE